MNISLLSRVLRPYRRPPCISSSRRFQRCSLRATYVASSDASSSKRTLDLDEHVHYSKTADISGAITPDVPLDDVVRQTLSQSLSTDQILATLHRLQRTAFDCTCNETRDSIYRLILRLCQKAHHSPGVNHEHLTVNKAAHNLQGSEQHLGEIHSFKFRAAVALHDRHSAYDVYTAAQVPFSKASVERFLKLCLGYNEFPNALVVAMARHDLSAQFLLYLLKKGRNQMTPSLEDGIMIYSVDQGFFRAKLASPLMNTLMKNRFARGDVMGARRLLPLFENGAVITSLLPPSIQPPPVTSHNQNPTRAEMYIHESHPPVRADLVTLSILAHDCLANDQPAAVPRLFHYVTQVCRTHVDDHFLSLMVEALLTMSAPAFDHYLTYYGTNSSLEFSLNMNPSDYHIPHDATQSARDWSLSPAVASIFSKPPELSEENLVLTRSDDGRHSRHNESQPYLYFDLEERIAPFLLLYASQIGPQTLSVIRKQFARAQRDPSALITSLNLKDWRAELHPFKSDESHAALLAASQKLVTAFMTLIDSHDSSLDLLSSDAKTMAQQPDFPRASISLMLTCLNHPVLRRTNPRVKWTFVAYFERATAVSPDVKILESFLKSSLSWHDLELTAQILKTATRLHLDQNRRMFLPVIRFFAHHKKDRAATHVWSAMRIAGISPNLKAYTNYASLFAEMGQPARVLSLMERASKALSHDPSPLDPSFATLILKAYVRARDIAGALSFVKRAFAKGFVPSRAFVRYLTSTARRHPELESAVSDVKVHRHRGRPQIPYPSRIPVSTPSYLDIAQMLPPRFAAVPRKKHLGLRHNAKRSTGAVTAQSAIFIA